jgi:hypothetical protein
VTRREEKDENVRGEGRNEEEREASFLPARTRREVEVEEEDEIEEDLFLAPDSPRGRVGSASEGGR